MFLRTDADSHTEPGDVFPIIAGGYEIRKRAEVSLNHGKILIKSAYKIQIYRDTAKELVKKLRNDIKHTQKKIATYTKNIEKNVHIAKPFRDSSWIALALLESCAIIKVSPAAAGRTKIQTERGFMRR